jgi:RHS repeat-associated protein
VTDQNDRIVGVHDYFAFGPELSGATAEPSATTLKYTGHERDNWSSGPLEALDYMHARYYSPWMGRFLSVDSHLGTPEVPQSWNRYAYTMGNPLKATDPDGNATFLVVYGNGAVGPQYRGQDHDQGDQFKVAAQTRANEIRSSGVLGTGDDVFVMSASNVDEFAAVTNHHYPTGAIASMDVFSHSWADPSPGNDPGPGQRGGLNLGGEGDRGVRPGNLMRIDKTNFSAGATITLWGCNAGKTPALGGASFAQAMADALGVTVRAHTGPAEFNKGGKGHPPMVPSNPVRGKMIFFNPRNKNLLRVQP